MVKRKVLVVDDEIIIADDLVMALNKFGYQPLEPALSYSEAVKSLAQQDIDIAILDINLNTKKSGIDIAHHIREHYNMPFVFLTSYTDSRTLELAKATMPYAYLVKPFEGEDVMTAIEIALNNHDRFSKSDEEQTVDFPEFTATEQVVLKKIAANKTTRQIAEELFVSESTVKNHRHNITKKLDLPATTNSLLTWVLSHKDFL